MYIHKNAWSVQKSGNLPADTGWPFKHDCVYNWFYSEKLFIFFSRINNMNHIINSFSGQNQLYVTIINSVKNPQIPGKKPYQSLFYGLSLYHQQNPTNLYSEQYLCVINKTRPISILWSISVSSTKPYQSLFCGVSLYHQQNPTNPYSVEYLCIINKTRPISILWSISESSTKR